MGPSMGEENGEEVWCKEKFISPNKDAIIIAGIDSAYYLAMLHAWRYHCNIPGLTYWALKHRSMKVT
jgi:hypothetical protein